MAIGILFRTFQLQKLMEYNWSARYIMYHCSMRAVYTHDWNLSRCTATVLTRSLVVTPGLGESPGRDTRIELLTRMAATVTGPFIADGLRLELPVEDARWPGRWCRPRP